VRACGQGGFNYEYEVPLALIADCHVELMKCCAGSPGMLTLSFPHPRVVGFSLSNEVLMYPTPRSTCKIGTVRSVPSRVVMGLLPAYGGSLYNLITNLN
jgi:hypothetical protein